MNGITKDHWNRRCVIKRAAWVCLSLLLLGVLAGTGGYLYDLIPGTVGKQTEYSGVRVGMSQDEGFSIKGHPPSQTSETYIIDARPSSGKPANRTVDISYVKTIGLFTSNTMPSVVLGMNSGLYLYTSSSGKLSGPWVKSTIDPVGEYYEQAAAFLKAGDTYPGVVVELCANFGDGLRDQAAAAWA